jgi:hypothetical protein
MEKANRVIVIVSAALLLAAIVTFWGIGSAVMAQAGSPLPTGPTTGDCFTASYHAASDCDRLASGQAIIPPTGVSAYLPTLQNCFTARFHAASDCDRLASEVYGLEGAK